MPLAFHPRGDEIEGGGLGLLGIPARLNSLRPVPAMMVLEFQLPMPLSPRRRWRLMPRLRMPSPLLLSTACTTPLSDLLRPVRAPRRHRRLLRRSRRRLLSRRPASNQPSRATFMRRLVMRLPPLPLLSQAPPPTPFLRRQRLRSRALMLRRSSLQLTSRQSGLRPAFSPPSRATRPLRLAPRPRQQLLARGRASP